MNIEIFLFIRELVLLSTRRLVSSLS